MMGMAFLLHWGVRGFWVGMSITCAVQVISSGIPHPSRCLPLECMHLAANLCYLYRHSAIKKPLPYQRASGCVAPLVLLRLV